MLLRAICNGQEGIVPIQVYSCGNCGHVPAKLMEGSGVEEKDLS